METTTASRCQNSPLIRLCDSAWFTIEIASPFLREQKFTVAVTEVIGIVLALTLH